MNEWKRNCIKIGAPTNLLAAALAFLPVLWLCSTYNCWPALNVVLAAWGMVALSFGAFYFVEPISYYAALGMSGTYLSFLSGNIGNMRVPVAALALESTESQPGTIQAEVSSTMAICGSIITNLVFTTMAALVGAAVVGNFAIKYHKVAVFALGIPLAITLFIGAPAWIIIVASVFGSLGVARFFYVRENKAA